MEDARTFSHHTKSLKGGSETSTLAVNHIDLDMIEQPRRKKTTADMHKMLATLPSDRETEVKKTSSICSSDSTDLGDFVVLEEINDFSQFYEKNNNKDKNVQEQSTTISNTISELLNRTNSNSKENWEEKCDNNKDETSDSISLHATAHTTKSSTDLQIEECLRALDTSSSSEVNSELLDSTLLNRSLIVKGGLIMSNAHDKSDDVVCAGYESCQVPKVSPSPNQTLLTAALETAGDSVDGCTLTAGSHNQHPTKRYVKQHLANNTEQGANMRPAENFTKQAARLEAETHKHPFIPNYQLMYSCTPPNSKRPKTAFLPSNNMSHSYVVRSPTTSMYPCPINSPYSRLTSAMNVNLQSSLSPETQFSSPFNPGFAPSNHGRFYCVLCNLLFGSETEMMMHNFYNHYFDRDKNELHKTQPRSDIPCHPGSTQKRSPPHHAYECPHCNITFMFKSMFGMHMQFHHPGNPLMCAKCGIIFSSIAEFYIHVLTQSHTLDLRSALDWKPPES